MTNPNTTIATMAYREGVQELADEVNHLVERVAHLEERLGHDLIHMHEAPLAVIKIKLDLCHDWLDQVHSDLCIEAGEGVAPNGVAP